MEVGKTFPGYKYISKDVTAIHFSESGFDVIVVMAEYNSNELQDFRTGKFNFGVFAKKNIPFLVISFQDAFSLDCPFNILGLAKQEAIEWFNRPVRLVNLFFVERVTGILQAKRSFGLNVQFADVLKTELRAQQLKYYDGEIVDIESKKIQRSYDNDQMQFQAKAKQCCQ